MTPEQAIENAMAVAAISGELAGADLLRELADNDRVTALSSIAPHFVIGRQVGLARTSIRWTLGRPARAKVLAGLLANAPKLNELLATPLPTTDRAGELLREILTTRSAPVLESLSRDDLLALSSVVEATKDLGLPLPTIDEIESARRRREERPKEVLLGNGLVGRKRELDELRAFVYSPQHAYSRWEGCLLAGLGGAGKSTIVAALAEELRADPSATCVVLDFDRPGIDPQDTYWLEMEIARQIEARRPDVHDMLRDARRQARKTRDSRRAAETDRSRGIIEALGNALVGARSFVLVFDTFEEVTQRDRVGYLFAWLDDLADRLSNCPVRVIFSGRLVTEDSQVALTLTRKQSLHVISVDELEREDAKTLLARMHVTPERAERLIQADAIPRRPLELKLIGRLVANLSEQDFGGVEKELSAFDKSALGELFGALVYRRVLLRIQDADARKLAYPGLLLRFIDAEIVEQVLVPALGISLDKTAAEAVDQLVTYSWLVEPGSRPGQVRHRRDLRRSVVAAMLENDREVAEHVHRAAIAYFETSNDSEYRREALYHRLMLTRTPEEGKNFRPKELVEMLTYLGGDIQDLPRPALALVRLDAGHELSAAELALLPEERRERAFDEMGERFTHLRQFSRATELQGPDGSSRWRIDLLWATGRFDELRRVLSEDGRKDRLAQVLFPAALLDPAFVSLSALENTSDSGLSTTDLIRIAAGLASYAVPENIRESLSRSLRALDPSAERDLFIRHIPELSTSCVPALWVANLRFDAETFRVLRNELLPIVGERWRSELEGFIDELERRVASADVLATLLARLVQFAPSCELGESPEWDVCRLPRAVRGLLYRGLDTVFRDPIRYAILEAVGGDIRRLRTAMNVLTELMPRIQDDVTEARFQEAIAPNPEHALEPFIELADRMNVLPAWVERLLTLLGGDSRTERLALVASVYERWRSDVEAAIDRMA